MRARSVDLGFLGHYLPFEARLAGVGTADVRVVASDDKALAVSVTGDAVLEKVRVSDGGRTPVTAKRVAVHGLAYTYPATVRVAEKISESAELFAVAQVIVDHARSILKADYAALGLGTDPDRPFHLWVFSGLDRHVLEMIGRTPRPVGVLGAVPRQGESLRLEDVAASADFLGLPPSHPKMGPFLGVPIHHAGRGVGNACVTSVGGLKTRPCNR